VGRARLTLRHSQTLPDSDLAFVKEGSIPYKYEKSPPLLCTYIAPDDPEPGVSRSTKWVENTRLRKIWYEPENYLELQRITEMKREASSAQKAKGKYQHTNPGFIGNYPTIEEYLGDCWWDDGKPRTPCHLKIEVVGNMVHVGLIDTEQRRSCHTTSGGLAEALEALEAHLAAGGAPWRSWGPQKGRN